MTPEPKRTWLPPALMAAAVAAIYSPPALGPGEVQLAMDFVNLHQRRMSFAREALFGPAHLLPAWYPREALGTPFWSNVQNFPFLPTRLLVLPLDPHGPFTYALAVMLAAVLAALFTWLFFRRLGLSPFAAAVGGWTFACCGYFSSRVAAGHLPLLEVFGALPLLLWAVDRLCERVTPTRLFALAGAGGVVMLGGHPQLPVYALAAAVLYLFFRGGFASARWGLPALGLGVACTSFVWLPAALLVGRSTRVLHLEAATNDVPLPWGRLLAFFAPWAQGVPRALDARGDEFGPWPVQVFWDTNCYVGLLPWVALVALLVARPKLERPQRFVLAVGGLALLFALPWFSALTHALPGTFLRSPARLLYFTELALALLLALAVEHFSAKRAARFVLPALALLHLVDLGFYDRRFVVARAWIPADAEAYLSQPLAQVGLGRVAVDHQLWVAFNREVDDVGFFDSLLLARPYRALVGAATGDPAHNIQAFDGAQLPVWMLQRAGVKLVYTTHERRALTPLAQVGPVHVYQVPSPGPRARFVPGALARGASPEELTRALTPAGPQPPDALLLSGEVPAAAGGGEGEAPVTLERPDPDHLVATLTAPEDGWLELVEAADPGWSVEVDGAPAEARPAMDTWMAVHLPAGAHRVAFTYRTPGAGAGIAVALAALAALGALALFRARRQPA